MKHSRDHSKVAKHRVLIVDDTPLNCDLLSRLLTHKGHDVMVVGDGYGALDVLRREHFDLILLDLMMPGIDGLGVLKKIREEHSNVELPVMMITAQTSSDITVSCLRAGANDYITRPFNMAVTLARIEAQFKVKEQAEQRTGELHKINGATRVTPKTARTYCPGCLSTNRGYARVCAHCQESRPKMGWPIIKDSPWPYLGKTLSGRYYLEQLVGQGSVCNVYRGRDIDLGRKFAIKITDFRKISFPKQARDQMLFEIKALTQLNSPHIVKIYQILKPEEDVWAIVMDYCDGGCLLSALGREARMEPLDAVDIARQIALALHEAHSIGIIHHDVKPSNVIIEEMPTGKRFARVLDFGIARLISQPMEGESFDGTPEYVAPEVITADKPVDERADIYALGATLYHMLTGEPPFSSAHIPEVLMAHLYTPIPSLPNDIAPKPLVAMLDRLLKRMMAKEPHQRFKDVESVLFALEGVKAELNAWL